MENARAVAVNFLCNTHLVLFEVQQDHESLKCRRPEDITIVGLPIGSIDFGHYVVGPRFVLLILFDENLALETLWVVLNGLCVQEWRNGHL